MPRKQKSEAQPGEEGLLLSSSTSSPSSSSSPRTPIFTSRPPAAAATATVETTAQGNETSNNSDENPPPDKQSSSSTSGTASSTTTTATATSSSESNSTPTAPPARPPPGDVPSIDVTPEKMRDPHEADIEATPEQVYDHTRRLQHRHHHHHHNHDRQHHNHNHPRHATTRRVPADAHHNQHTPGGGGGGGLPPKTGSLGSLFGFGSSSENIGSAGRQTSPTRHQHNRWHPRRSNTATPILLEQDMSEFEQEEARRHVLYYLPVVLRSVLATALPFTVTQWAYLLLENVAYFFAARHAASFIVAGDAFMLEHYGAAKETTQLGADTAQRAIHGDERSLYDATQDNSPAATAVICVTIGFALVYLTSVVLIGIVMALDTLCSHLSLPPPAATQGAGKDEDEKKKPKKKPGDGPLSAASGAAAAHDRWGDDDDGAFEDGDEEGGLRKERFVTSRHARPRDFSPVGTLSTNLPVDEETAASAGAVVVVQSPDRTRMDPAHAASAGSQPSSQPTSPHKGLYKFHTRSMENFINFSASSLDDLTDVGDMLRSAATHEVISSIVDQALTLLMSACVCVGITYVVLLAVWLSVGLTAVDRWLDPSVQRGVKTYVLVCMLFQVVPVVGSQILIKYMQNVTYTSFRHQHNEGKKGSSSKGGVKRDSEEEEEAASNTSTSSSSDDEDKTEQERIRKKFKTVVMRPVLLSAAAITLASPLVQYCTVSLAYRAVRWGALLQAMNVRKEWADTYLVRNLGILSSIEGGVPVSTVSWLIFALAVGQCLISWTEFAVLFYQFSPYPHELRAEAAVVRQQTARKKKDSPLSKQTGQQQQQPQQQHGAKWYGSTDENKAMLFPSIATTSPPASASTHPYVPSPSSSDNIAAVNNTMMPSPSAGDKSGGSSSNSALLFPRLTVKTWAVQYWNPHSIVSYYRTALYSVSAFIVEGFTVNAMLLLVSVTGCNTPNQVGGFYLAMQAAFVFFPIVYGIGSASTTTIGVAFRRLRDGHLAKSTAVTSIGLAIVLSIVNASILMVAAPFIIPAIFSVEHMNKMEKGQNVVEGAHHNNGHHQHQQEHEAYRASQGMIHAAIGVVPYVAMYHIFDFLQFVLQSLMRGIGRFRLLVATTFLAQWLVGLPLGVSLLVRACNLHHGKHSNNNGHAADAAAYGSATASTSHFFSDVRSAASGGTSDTGPPLIIVGYVLGILLFELPVFIFALFCATRWWDPDETAMKHYHPHHHMPLKQHQNHHHHHSHQKYQSALRQSPTLSSPLRSQQHEGISLDLDASELHGSRRVHFSHSADN